MNEHLERTLNRTRRLSDRDRMQFAHRLSLFLRSGIPIVTALSYICADARTSRTRDVYSAVADDVASGIALALALERHRPAFSTFDIALVRVGERSGRLHESLAYAASLIERERALRSRLTGALLYPGLVLVAALAIVLFLVLYAFPNILPLFRGFDETLPLTTRVLIGLSDGISSHGLLILASLAGLAVGAILLDRGAAVRRWRQYHGLRLPLVGSMMRAYQLAMIARVLGTVVQSGIGLVLALELAEEATENAAYRAALRRARQAIFRGKRMSTALAELPVLFPPVVAQIVGTGELTGNLAESLLQVAEMHDEEVRERSQHITTLAEPVLMIGTGLVVGFIALAIITPIYQITQGLYR